MSQVVAEAELVPAQLDPSILCLSEFDKEFLRDAIAQDEEEMKAKIIEIQKIAYAKYPYPCILGFHFVTLFMAINSVYPYVVETGKTGNSLFLDIGCCMGTDLRKLVKDGYPVSNLIGCDIRQEFIDCGHQLFHDRNECKIRFFIEDIFTLPYPLPSSFAPPSESLDLLSLVGRLTHIHVGALFHLYGEDIQYSLALRVTSLLKRQPGAVIFGRHQGLDKEGLILDPNGAQIRYGHSAESWKILWHRVFSEIESSSFADEHVRADAVLLDGYRGKEYAELDAPCLARAYNKGPSKMLYWSVRIVPVSVLTMVNVEMRNSMAPPKIVAILSRGYRHLESTTMSATTPSTSKDTVSKLRPLGLLERYHVTLHQIGFDSCVVVSAQYKAERPLSKALVYGALKYAIEHQVKLGVQIDVSKAPRFTRLKTIDLSRAVDIATEMQPLQDLFSSHLSTPFQLGTDTPLWRLTVLPDNTVIFVYHHATGDGQSGLAFHHIFLAGLNTLSETAPDPSDGIVTVPTTLIIEPPTEKLTNTSVSLKTFFHVFFELLAPISWTPASSAWTANPVVKQPSIATNAHAWEISAEDAKLFLQLCRSHDTTLTGALHTLGVLVLSRFLVASGQSKRYKTIATCIPISLRRYTGMPPEAMCDQASAIYPYVPFLYQTEHENPVDAFPWQTSARFSNTIQGTMKESLEGVGTIKYLYTLGISRKYFLDMLGKKRDVALSFSNVGRFPSAADGAAQGPWGIGSMHFGQCDSVYGAAMKTNIVGSPSGTINIVFTWAPGAMDDATAEAYIAGFKEEFHSLNTSLALTLPPAYDAHSSATGRASGGAYEHLLAKLHRTSLYLLSYDNLGLSEPFESAMPQNTREVPLDPAPLDPSLLTLSDGEQAFLQEIITPEDNKLKRKVLEVQKIAYAQQPYPCIRAFHFLNHIMSLNPAYPKVLEYGKSGHTLLLDLGCCMGTDVRKIVKDGYPPSDVFGCDLRQVFIDLGYQLYDDRNKCQIRFFADDIFELPYPEVASTTQADSGDLILRSLVGKLTHIYTGALFHLFDEAGQYALALRLTILLKTEPGAVIFGQHQGLDEEGLIDDHARKLRYGHSAQSWPVFWQRVFSEVESPEFAREHVRVEAVLTEGFSSTVLGIPRRAQMLSTHRRRTVVKSDALEEQAHAQSDPWAIIDKTMKGLDEDKIHDCKEDMDTLLVFAGLYSAVLTSFLVQSYQNLLQNPQEVMVDLLRQISSQTSSYTLSNGYLNSTASPFSLASSGPFQPAITDVRVNTCWFASLILSLSTASFGILVKQWAQEYLTIHRTVPQVRIRIRLFRYHGIQEWKLFDIAAALPLVLQLSLALFFTGLCFFTSEINPTLSTTSLCLVCGWAMLFSFTFVAPLMSARCPYNTAFLKSAFRRLRPHVRTLAMVSRRSTSYVRFRISSATHQVFQLLTHVSYSFTAALQSFVHSLPSFRTLLRPLRKLVCALLRTVSTAQDTAPENPVLTERQPGSTIPPNQRMSVAHSASSLDPSEAETESSLSLYEEQVIRELTGRFVLKERTVAIEEDELHVAEDRDMVIFRNVDAVLQDDGLLATIRGALQRQPPRGEDVLGFVVSALNSRLGTYMDGSGSGHIFSQGMSAKLEQLASSTRHAFISILSDAVERRMEDDCISDVIKLIIVLAQEGISLPESSTFVLQQFISRSDTSGCWVLAQYVIAPDKATEHWQKRTFSVLNNILRTLDPGTLKLIIHWTYLDFDDPTLESNTYGRILDQVEGAYTSDVDLERKVSLPVLEVLLDLTSPMLQDLVKDVLNSESKQLDKSTLYRIRELLQFFLDAVPIIEQEASFDRWYSPRMDQIDTFINSFFASGVLRSVLFECLEAHRGYFSSESLRYIIEHPAYTASSSLTDDRRAHILLSFAEYLEGQRSRRASRSVYATLLIYSVSLQFSTNDKHRALEKRISHSVAKHLEESNEIDVRETPSGRSIAILAHSILSDIDEHDEHHVSLDDIAARRDEFEQFSTRHINEEDNLYARWKERFDVNDSVYPDAMIAALRGLSGNTTDSFGRTFWRIRRLEDIGRAYQNPPTASVQKPTAYSASAIRGIEDAHVLEEVDM
ncbi:hypothetical protein NM688_g277 [Phlebia brevispora]|uniref:Uncharacterized protein n=1 Tax=Phlebia brevispora TaxID=194682 RepID=A0ACC1TEW8_9APHY|nr:hypothetical protein NM688_g277 [Phlebia brevispora]